MRFLLLLAVIGLVAAQIPSESPSSSAAESPASAGPGGHFSPRACTIPFRTVISPVAGQTGSFSVVFTPQVDIGDVEIDLLYSVNKMPAPGTGDFDFNVKMTKMDGTLQYTINGLNKGDKLALAFAYTLPNMQSSCKTGTILETIPSTEGPSSIQGGGEGSLTAFAPEQQFTSEQLSRMEQLSNQAINDEIERMNAEKSLLERQKMLQRLGTELGSRGAISSGRWGGHHGGWGGGFGGWRRGLGLGLGLGLGYPGYGYGYGYPGYGYGYPGYGGYEYGYPGYGGYEYGYPGYGEEYGLGARPVVCPIGYGFDRRANLCVPVPVGPAPVKELGLGSRSFGSSTKLNE